MKMWKGALARDMRGKAHTHAAISLSVSSPYTGTAGVMDAARTHERTEVSLPLIAAWRNSLVARDGFW